MSTQRGYFTVDEVRAAEAELFTRVPDGVPMRRAAYGLARVIAAELRSRTGGVAGRSVTLLVGSGDNGGDALWTGSMLRRRGVTVTAVLLNPERAHAEGLAALRATGGRIGDEIGRADVTVAFGALKPVHALAAPYCGRIELVPIGLRLPEPGIAALDPGAVGAEWPVPGPTDDKYSQGVTGVCAGSATYPGAAVLCTGAAVAATSGMVRYAGTGAGAVLARFPEVVAAESISATGRVQSWIFGPGSGTDSDARDRLAEILATALPVVVDADGLTLLAADPALVRGLAAPTVLTPHAGEFARLTGHDVGSDRVAAVRELAESWELTVLLKGRATVVAAPGRPVLVNEAGGSWAATAGAGDVLSGIIGALLAAGRDPLWCAAAGARAHSLAANLAANAGDAAAPTSAGPLLDHLRRAIGTLRAAPPGRY